MAKIAIIGTGISGLGAAYLLHRNHDITVYEKNPVTGGHSRTIDAKTPQGTIPVDTGFIVFNTRNYPLLTGLFNHLDVPVEKSDMSFAASIGGGWLEYGTESLPALFAQKRNLLRPAYWGMLRDVMAFFKQSPKYLESGEVISLAACLEEMGMGDWFRKYFLLPISGAIWSTPTEAMHAFPAQTLIRFFQNHGLLSLNDQPQWYTVTGGSREYVSRITAPYKDRIRVSCGGKKVFRNSGKVSVEDTTGHRETYEHIIFACHPDQALAMLDAPTEAERRVIGAFRYQPNTVILHGDIRFLPKRRAIWASWNYRCDARIDDRPAISLSYYMNRLQNIDTATPLIVTLNPATRPPEDLIYDETVLEHPIFDRAAIAAQGELAGMNGQEKTWYCGAWTRYGFHEDGLMSAVSVAQKLGASIPWT